MRKVYLDNLPRWDKGTYKDKIKWKDSEGCILNFIYDDIEGEIEIINFDSNRYRIDLIYNNQKFNKSVGDLITCKISSIIGKRSSSHIYNNGEIVNVKHGKIKILKKTYTRKRRGYDYECLTCSHQNHISESHLKEGVGCPVCSGQKVKIGINDMWTTNPELAKLLLTPEDGHKYTQCGSVKLNWKCLNCGYVLKNKGISEIHSRGISCPRCSDNISYPEKFVFNLLNQLNVNFETQKTFLWSQSKRYDFYLSDINCLIEVHGVQHYENNRFSSLNGARSLKEEQKNDEIKKGLAEANGIEHYVVIDCRRSNIDWIRDNIIESKLLSVLNFNIEQIDWNECHAFACNTMVKNVCNLWNSGIRSITLIGREISLHRSTVGKYLKQGTELGWCYYNPNVKCGSKVAQLSLTNKLIKIWGCVKDAQIAFGFASQSSITNAIHNKEKSAGGYKWMYLEDYEEYIKQVK